MEGRREYGGGKGSLEEAEEEEQMVKVGCVIVLQFWFFLISTHSSGFFPAGLSQWLSNVCPGLCLLLSIPNSVAPCVFLNQHFSYFSNSQVHVEPMTIGPQPPVLAYVPLFIHSFIDQTFSEMHNMNLGHSALCTFWNILLNILCLLLTSMTC